MSGRNWIPVRGAQGRHSRQAHADMPPGTFEREISKEGFFGPAAFMHHRRPPTSWVNFEGPLRPRAFDLNALKAAEASPWEAGVVLRNAAVEVRFWRLDAAMPDLARNADGDQLRQTRLRHFTNYPTNAPIAATYDDSHRCDSCSG